MTSPYASGGGGHRFEATVAAYYLSAVLAEAPARGLPGTHATQVRFQRGELDFPLDDLVISGHLRQGVTSELQLQVKTQLSFTNKDGEWRAVLAAAWDAVNQDHYDSAIDRVGVAISSYHAQLDKNYQSVLSWAASSDDGSDFMRRIAQEDFSNDSKRKFVRHCATILGDILGHTPTDEELWRLLRTFIIVHFDFQSSESSRDATHTRERLRHLLDLADATQAENLWAHLNVYAGALNESAGSVDRAAIVAHFSSVGIPLASAPSFSGDIDRVALESTRALADINETIQGLHLHRADAYDKACAALESARFVQIDGAPGSGKSALLKSLAKDHLRHGPIFFLKDARVHPRGWSAHAHVLGVSDDLERLLQEFAGTGESILFIDGIDKIIDPAAQLTINDLIRAIATQPNLSDWRVLTTVRSQNLNHLDTWLDPEALSRLSFQNVTLLSLNQGFQKISGCDCPLTGLK